MSFSTSLTNILDTDSGNLYQLDHRQFAVQNCDAKAAARRQALDATKSGTGLISGLSKLAGIEGTGVVQQALDAIVSATHVGGTEWENIVNNGAEGVLSSVIGSQATNLLTGALNDVSPHAVNTAMASATAVYDKIKNQDLDWKDIPQYVADFKNLYTLGTQIVDPFLTNNAASQQPITACSASPYATDLVRYGVKFKFLFVAHINFRKNYLNMANVDPSFIVKTADRPSITYEYEDINMYNFRTKVAKRSSYAPVKFTFYDDEQNTAVAFYNAMMRLMTPSANNVSPLTLETTGMDFGNLAATSTGTDSGAQGIPTYSHGASIGPMLGTDVSIIESIDLYHVYSGGQKVNQYRFINPRVTTLGLDSMDMANEGTTELEMEFAYDAIEITNAVSMTNITGGHIDIHPGFKYPLGGPNPQTTASTSASLTTTASSGLAELYAKGEAYVEGVTSSVTSSASSLFSSITSLV